MSLLRLSFFHVLDARRQSEIIWNELKCSIETGAVNCRKGELRHGECEKWFCLSER